MVFLSLSQVPLCSGQVIKLVQWEKCSRRQTVHLTWSKNLHLPPHRVDKHFCSFCTFINYNLQMDDLPIAVLRLRVVQKQRRTAISPATQLTCAVYFFYQIKEIFMHFKCGEKRSNIDKCMPMTTKWRHIFTKSSGGGPPVPPSLGSKLLPIISFLSPPVHIARWAHMHRFLSVRLSVTRPKLLDNISYLEKYWI